MICCGASSSPRCPARIRCGRPSSRTNKMALRWRRRPGAAIRSKSQREEAAMRKDIQFKTEDGVTLRGWLYLPDLVRGRVPIIVMAHGFSALKENYLDKYAEIYSAAGLGALVFDNRNCGASDGKPRQHIDPWRQVADYRDAITNASTLSEVDENRIGVWGSSYS